MADHFPHGTSFPSNFPIYVFFCLKYITSIWFSLVILNTEGLRPPFFFLHWSSELELKKNLLFLVLFCLAKIPLHSPTALPNLQQ